MTVKGLSFSKPSTRRPSRSMSVKPRGPLILVAPRSLPQLITASIRLFATSKSSMKSIQPKRTVFSFHFSLAWWFTMAATRPATCPSLYTRYSSRSQNSKDAFLGPSEVYSSSSNAGTHLSDPLYSFNGNSMNSLSIFFPCTGTAEIDVFFISKTKVVIFLLSLHVFLMKP